MSVQAIFAQSGELQLMAMGDLQVLAFIMAGALAGALTA
jgi:hypothetical protein